MIHIPAFSLTGTADFSSIRTELQNLERTIGNLKVPQIKTDVATPNFSNFFSAIDKAEKQATIKIKPEIDNSFMGGLTNSLTGQKGKFSSVGKELGSSLTMGMQQQFGMAGGVASSFATALGPIGIAAGVAGAGILALGAASVSAAKDWQTMMASVSKTTGIEGAELTKLSSTLQEIRMQTGATAEAISGAVVTAGSIGIPKEELASFAQLSLQMASAFGMSADSAAMAMGQIGNVAKPAEMSWTEFTTRAGSSVNVLADSMATSEEQILTGMKHLGATMGLLKPPADTISDWQALVATIQSLGLTGDTAGEAIQDAMQYATKDAKGAISGLLGISAEELQINLRTNAPEVMMDAAKAISALPLSEQGQALASFGQTGQKAIALLMGDLDQTTGKFTLLGKAINDSGMAWNDATSLSLTYAKSQETLDAALSKLSASLEVTATKLGTVLLPMVTAVVEALNAGVIAADKFATTTLPNWAQGTTDWVNETLGMTEDTPEQIAERKAKIARTAEKTATKVADTTGYQSYAEAQASAANLGQGTGNSYVDGLNSALDVKLPSDAFSKYLAPAYEAAKKESSIAGKQTAEEFTKSQDEYIKSHSSGSYTSEMMQQMSAQQSVESGPAYKYAYQQKLLDSVIYPLADSYKIQKYSRSTDIGGFLQVTDIEGEVITSEQYTSDEELDKLAKRLKDSVKPTFTDMPKYMKTAGDDISDALTNILSDGVIAFEEKDELKNYLKSLETLETTYSIQFEASHLDDLKSKIEDAVAGTLITFDASEISLNFSRFISENAEMYNKIYQKTGVISYESNEKLLHDALLSAPKEAQDLYAELQSAVSSGDFQSLQEIPSIIQEIGDVAPELLVLKGTTDRLNTAQEEWEDNYLNLGKTTAEASENGDRMDGTFLRTSQTADILGRGFTGMASAEYDQARAVKAAKSGMEMLYSPIITTKDGLKTLDKPLTDLSTTGNALDAAFVDTTVCVGNANIALSSFADALNSAAGRISSLSTYETRSYAPTVAGTAYTSLNTYAAQSARAYDPLEMILAYNKNLPKFAKGGISLTKGLAQVDANELHIPADQLPCAVSSLYDVLENPNLFFPTGLGTITDSTGATYPTQAKLESFGQTIDTANLSLESANFGILKLSSGATYVSDRWMDEYDRFTITAPGTGFQSSGKRGYVPVSISAAAKENIIYNPFTDESNWQAAGMDAKIFAMQQQYAGKSSVMPSGANTKPDWIVNASNGIISKYSEGVLNSLAVEYDSLQAVNTEKVRYADLQGTELRNILMQSDAIIDATAAGGEYCEAMSQFGIATEEAARTAERNGMFQKAYIGPSKYYEQAKEYFAGNDVVDAIGKTTEKVSDVEDAVDDSANEYGKYGRALDALANGIFSGFKSLAGTGALIQPGKLSQTSKWYMDEFYTIEYGLGQCVDYLSDFAILQEGVFSDVLFKPSYIGKTEGYAGAGKGGLPGYSNIAEILPQNALEMQEAASRFADAADMTDANYQLSKIGETSKATQNAVTESAKANSATAKNTQEMSADMKASMAGMGYSSTGQLVATNGGTGGWGGTSIGGGGGWIGTSGSYTGMNGSVYYGSTVGGIGAVASQQARSGGYSIGSFSAGNAIQYAEGGITDHPVFGVFGEAGREAFVPISDRAAGRRILPQVMKELGVRTFATGGIAGSGGLSALVESIGGNTFAPVYHINGSGLSSSQLATVLEKHDKKLLEQVAKKTVLSARRRG